MKARTMLVFFFVFSLMLIAVGCGGAANTNTTANTANTNANRGAANTTTTNTSATNTNTETAKTDSSDPNTGVAECDEYIKKYEACLTKIAKQAPQAEPAMRSAFAAQRDGFKTAASTPQGKATLASTCKQAMDTAKASTAAYACEW